MAEVSTIPAFILANENLLFWMLSNPLSTRFETYDKRRNLLREFVYVDFHRWNATRPDHVFRHRWKNFHDNYLASKNPQTGLVFAQFSKHHKNCSIVLAALKCLADEYIEIRNGNMHVKLDRFGWWQNMLSRISSLPLQALKLWMMEREGLIPPSNQGYGTHQKDSTSINLYPYDAGVENYISRNGINDSHVHINLCANAEECWLNAFDNPEEEWFRQQEKYEKRSDVAELYREIHVNLTPKMLWYDHLRTACRLRFLLVCYATDQLIFYVPKTGTAKSQEARTDTGQRKNKKNPLKGEGITADQYLHLLEDIPPECWTDEDVPIWRGAPAETHRHDVATPPNVLEELEWMKKLIHKLALAPDARIDRAFHLYLLLMNEFLSFCVQRDNLYGFKQFQKYSSIKTSFVDQPYYYYRVFERMHGSSPNSMTNYMELRVAPSTDARETAETLQAILHGYWQYALNRLKKEKPDFNFKHTNTHLESILSGLEGLFSTDMQHIRIVRPVIVPHLIKQEWKEEDGPVRYSKQRAEYTRALRGLDELLKNYPKLRRWIRGIDAAADEMETPPDVFAPAYRMARNVLHLPRATYHAGEDFYHLISGIRAVCEAVKMLDLQRGDRIGHAVALGVNPQLWLNTMPGMVTPTRGEWLQDLIFTWNLLQKVQDHPELIQRLNVDIREHGYAVFRKSHLSPYILKRVFDLRHLDPDTLIATSEYAKEQLLKRKAYPISMADIIREVERSQEHVGVREYEKQLVYQTFAKEAPEVMELIINWQQDQKTREHSDERIEIPTDYFNTAELLLIQQQALSMLVEKAIVLETMPTSNLRIGQYKEMGQHHSLRWLGVSAEEGDIAPLVVLGSDDPGIFATDIKAEFYHIYASLRKRGLNSREALEKLIDIDENGNRYAFRSLAGNAAQ